jgi:hypothetical protein
MGTASSLLGPPTAQKMETGRWCVPQEDWWPDVQEEHGVKDAVIKDRRSKRTTEISNQWQYCKRNFERMDARKRCRGHPKCNNGLRKRGLKERLDLWSTRIFCRIFMKTAELEIAKQIVGASIRLRKMSNWTLWRGRPPPERKKRPLATE